jgi:hypothetical protein
MAENKTVNLEVNSNLAETEKAVTSLKTQLRLAQQEVASLSDKFGATSKEAVEAAKRAAELKDRIGDAKSLTDAFNPDAKFKALSTSLGGVASGFAAYQGALGLIGVESKEVEAQILKVQSAMAIAQGAQAVGESVDAFKQLGAVVKSYSIVQKAITAGQWLWNAAMAANPIGAIVAIVVALVAAGYALVKMFIASSDATMKAEAANKALNKELDTQIKNQKLATQEADLSRDAQLKMAKASGKSAEEIRKLSVELANQEVNQKYANAQTLRAIAIEAMRVAGLEDATDAQKETAKNALKAFNDANDALKTSVLNRRKLLIDNKVAETQEQTDATKEANKKQNELADKAHEELKARLKKEAEDLLRFKEEIAKNARDKQREESYKAQDDIEEARKANADRLLTDEQLAIQKENEAYKIKYENAVKAGLDTEELDKQHKNNLANINNEYFAKEAEKSIENDAKRKERDAKEIADAQIVADAKLAIQNAQLDNVSRGIGLLQGLGIKNKAIQKGLVIAENAAGIAKTIINTMAANAKAVAASPLTGGQPFVTANTISASIGVATSIAATAKALSALGGGGGGNGGGSMPSVGGGGAAPQFNVVGNSGVNQLAETMQGRSAQAPIQAYVVANDVTTAQGLNRNIVTNASLG